ncbi:hypothetical protein YB2330_005603 [Saitoella coloradoensis]
MFSLRSILPSLRRSAGTAPAVQPVQTTQIRTFKGKINGQYVPVTGHSLTFKQQDRGLYGGKHIQFGNSISEFKNKNRRTWLPNIQRSTLYSKTLNQKFRMKVTTGLLRTLDKVGGLDAYVTGCKMARMKEIGVVGWRLRNKIHKKMLENQKQEEMSVDEEGLPPIPKPKLTPIHQLKTRAQIKAELIQEGLLTPKQPVAA